MTVRDLLLYLVLHCLCGICDGGCSGAYKVPGMHGCVHDGLFIPLGTSMKINCMRCFCNQLGGLTCCSISSRHIYPDFCMAVPDGPCDMKGVMMDDPSVPCDAIGGIG